MVSYPEGMLQSYEHADFFKSSHTPFLLNSQQAFELVKQSMNFKTGFTFNMQHSLISKKFIQSLLTKGKFFQSPYPDFYATNVSFLKAKRILVCPIPLVTIGVSQQSFGYYYFNKREKQGSDFLKNLPDAETIQHMQHVLLPGYGLHSSWLLAMETIKLNYGFEFGLKVNYRRYRLLQLYQAFRQHYRDKNSSSIDVQEMKHHMTLMEKLIFLLALRFAYFMTDIFPKEIYSKLVHIAMKRATEFPTGDSVQSQKTFNTILEVFEKVDPIRDRLTRTSI